MAYKSAVLGGRGSPYNMPSKRKSPVAKYLAPVATLSFIALFLFLLYRTSYEPFRYLAKRNDKHECFNVVDAEKKKRCNYLIYCVFPFSHAISYIILAAWLIFLFLMIGVASSDFFCPNISYLAEYFGLSEATSGVTLLAFGNASPDIFSTFAAVRNGLTTMALCELIGSAIFIVSVVTAIIGFMKPFKATSYVFLRDAGFLFGAIFLTSVGVAFGELNIPFGVALLIYYAIYACVVIYNMNDSREPLPSQPIPEMVLTLEENSDIESNVEIPIDAQTKHDVNTYTAKTQESSQLLQDEENHDISDRSFRSPATHSDYLAVANEVHLRNSGSTNRSKDRISVVIHELPLKRSLFPTLYKLKEAGTIKKIAKLSVAIPFLLLTLSIPVVREDNEQNISSNRPVETAVAEADFEDFEDELLVNESQKGSSDHESHKTEVVEHRTTLIRLLQSVIAPIFIARKLYSKITVLGAVMLAVIVSAAMITLALKFPDTKTGRLSFCFLGFLSAIAWIEMLTSEVVRVLNTFGIVLHISEGLLGLTVFAAGNSIGDLVSNTYLAKSGFPEMAMGGVFGGPMLNILLGIGISAVYYSVKKIPSQNLRTPLSPLLLSSLGALLFLMICMLALVPLNNFKIDRKLCISLVVIFVILTTVNVGAGIISHSVIY